MNTNEPPLPCGAVAPMDGVFYAYYEYGFWEMTGNKFLHKKKETHEKSCISVAEVLMTPLP